MRGILEHLIKHFISWRFRKRSPFLITFSGSITVLIAVLGLGSLTGALSYQDVTLELTQSDSVAFAVLNSIVVIAATIMLLSFIVLVIQFVLDRMVGSKQKVIVIEGRGLRDDNGVSLADSLGSDFPNTRVPHILDLRQRLDGKLVDPEALIPKVAAAKESLNQMRSAASRGETQVVYGGLTAVPFTFLTGVEFDDEGAVSVFDWDRVAEQWRPLDDLDDGLRLSEPALEEMPKAEEALLAISVSYPIDDEDLATSFDLPVVRMELEGRSSSAHWSGGKQSAIANQFLEVAKQLSERGVKHIHLVLAAPNSVVFNFGRRYDKRNLPEITVYQFEQSQDVRYPWGVRMPVSSTATARVERSPHAA